MVFASECSSFASCAASRFSRCASNALAERSSRFSAMSLALSDESTSRMRTAMSSTRSCLSSADEAARMMDRMALRGDPPLPGSARPREGVFGDAVTDPTTPSSSVSSSESHSDDRFRSSRSSGWSRFFFFPRPPPSPAASSSAAVACSAGPAVIVSHVFANPWNQLPPGEGPSRSTTSSFVRVTRRFVSVSRRAGRMCSSSDVVVDALPVAPEGEPSREPVPVTVDASTTTGEDVVDELLDSPAPSPGSAFARDSLLIFFFFFVVVVVCDATPSRHASSHAPTNAPTNSSSSAPSRAPPRLPRGRTRRRARSRAVWVAHDRTRSRFNPPGPLGTCAASAAPTMAPSSTPRGGSTSSSPRDASWDAGVRDAACARA
mmetsp:Transcript_10840/g.46957  ORF Transcript_10840/g.46957 Transcript_10840/m.46957 type:complete len:376 (+) Transcript_10840:1691-2818(+)